MQKKLRALLSAAAPMNADLQDLFVDPLPLIEKRSVLNRDLFFVHRENECLNSFPQGDLKLPRLLHFDER